MSSSTLTPVRGGTPRQTGGSGRDGRGFGGGGSWEAYEWIVPSRTYKMAMWVAMAAVVMLFAAFTSAMVVRRGLSTDWVSFRLPRILGLSTAILLASSVTLELSRRALREGAAGSFARWLYVTTLLGLMFVGSQLAAWRELASRGVYLASNPSSSFFYLLTAAHGVHLLGGIIALFYLVARAGRISLQPRQATALDVTAIYWHFMDGLWLYILLLLIVRS
jgi:cytochrome c oxidase subunit 3